jgi:CIC family chloride channel protein
MMGTAKQARRHPSACGAAAGLSAAFNAPLAATTFVLEEIVQDLNSRSLGKILLASLVGAFAVWALVGPDPAFQLQRITKLSWVTYLLIPLVAAAAALAGWAFQVSSLWVRKITTRWRNFLPQIIQPVLGGWVTWGIGIWIFWEFGRLGVFGLGHEDLTDALAHNIEWKVALALCLAKLVATVFAYGLSGCGGIFSPTLFIGGMAGAALGAALQQPLNLGGDDLVMLAAIGMSACMGAVVRAPMTTILIVFEMTHEFYVVPGLMLGTLVSQFIGRSLTKHNFYESLLRQDGYDMDKVIPPRDLQSWQKLPIAAIMNFQLVALRSFEPSAIKDLLDNTEHRRWPVIINGELRGIVSRPELTRAYTEEREPRLSPATTIEPRQNVREAQAAIIKSAMDIVMVKNQGQEGDDPIIGVVTLHDVLRVQMKMADTN